MRASRQDAAVRRRADRRAGRSRRHRVARPESARRRNGDRAVARGRHRGRRRRTPAALELNKGFFLRFTRQRPWVRVKVAASLDGRTAMASGESQWITGDAARADVQYWRARSCAIVTGVGTVLADDPQLNVRDVCLCGRRRDPATAARRRRFDAAHAAEARACCSAPGKAFIATVAPATRSSARRCRRGDVRDERSAGRYLAALFASSPRAAPTKCWSRRARR